ncbi:MAG: hypothetical protein II680_14890, partial [Clostridia bacterium]|nr:hypothetical protein [Clostridia bacterium]
MTPLGHDIKTFWENLLKGQCAIKKIENINAENLPVKVAAEIMDFKPEDFGIDKATIRHNDRCTFSGRCCGYTKLSRSVS